jgi:hypothetical protein
MGDALADIEFGFIQALQALDRQPGAKGGRKTNNYLYGMVFYLAEKWVALNRRVSTGSKSEFVAFCEAVTAAIGWPTDGILTAVRLRRWKR